MELESIKKNVNVTTLNGEVISFIVSKEKHPCGKNVHMLKFRRMVFNSESGKWMNKFAGKYVTDKKSSYSQIVACSCTIDSRTGQNFPCILLKKHKKGSTFGYILLILQNSNKIEHHLDFELDYEMKENLTLLTGPSVYWSCGNQVLHVSLQTNGILSIPLLFTAVTWIGEISDGDIIILGTRKMDRPIKQDKAAVHKADKQIWGSEFITYSIKKKQMCNRRFIPNAYSSVVTHILNCPFVNADNPLKTTIIAITCKNQLIIFENCIPKNICQLPFEDACEIKMATTGRENHLILLSSRSGNVCAVSKESWQVVAVWEDIWSIQLDDFLGIGTEQILLFARGCSTIEDCLKDFILTDLGEYSYRDNSELAEDKTMQINNTAHVNRHHTVQALEARLQSGLTSLKELKHLLRSKERVLLQSSKALINLIEGKHSPLPSAEEEGLVSLWHDEGTDLQISTEKISSTDQTLTNPVQKIWQRVVDDCWIVGAQISESATLIFDSMSLSLVMDPDPLNAAPMIHSQSKVLKLRKPGVSPLLLQCPVEPPFKKSRLDLQDIKDLNSCRIEDPCFQIYKDHTQTITAVTNLSPLLVFSNIHCSVLLHGMMMGSNQKTISPCGKVSLNLEDIWNEKYTTVLMQNPSLCTDEAAEDFYAIIATSQRSFFRILSRDYTLPPVKDWLLGPMQCEPLKIYPEYWRCLKMGFLLNWRLQNPFKGILTVIWRNKSVLLMFLHSLIEVLTQDCEITHMRPGIEDQMTDVLGHDLEQEALAFRNCIISAIGEAENEFTMRTKAEKKKNIFLSSPLLDSEAKLQEYREKFKVEQEQSILGMNLSITVPQYRQITKELTDMQLNTDSSAWRLSRFHTSFSV
ncbi:Fanconi anemia group B protein [Hypanus sabinus]|uniref:Fanconi anemia group B protein n=1 Tax=Hypanus sabinus TaxID=79690 RepID=UPI0028C41B9E|nr:Fanconi anemia group B protein [Hypanus sabinus]